jgi:hypothetical protein
VKNGTSATEGGTKAIEKLIVLLVDDRADEKLPRNTVRTGDILKAAAPGAWERCSR